MPDDKSKSGGQDRNRISLSDDYEVRDWATKFGVTKEELTAAVQRVGNDAKAVEADLKAARPG
jgi:putative heme degradation protein